MNRRKKVAALLTCHNRRELTLQCLRTLESQTGVDDFAVHVYLVDDGSTDGTGDAVRNNFPDVKVINGDGSLFWTGGMRRAMEAAADDEPEFYLWLNDDTYIYSDALARLFATFSELVEQDELPSIIVGSLRDPVTGELTYGGSRRSSRWHPLRFRRIEPDSSPRSCDVFNGNLVLFHRAAVEATGSLDLRLLHVGGDYDYALRAGYAGVRKWIAPGYFGECSRNAVEGSWMDPDASLKERFTRLIGLKGQPPGGRLVYYRAHGGPFWFVLYPLVYARPLLSWVTQRFGRR